MMTSDLHYGIKKLDCHGYNYLTEHYIFRTLADLDLK